ncbi:hypothetical protein [Nitrosomonas sp. Nm58]|uniref:hypothetical protein n=1 Tax=Nitrosomonas sp. Nm58 TaxID=200126 RepID=UPI00089B4E7C|nr:hypothetical protein [Nitrosomonas sp. Nm58]SDY92505.1 hypothetical protein SAMN05421754_103130 [Nitrosomonas sp. Nm58]
MITLSFSKLILKKLQGSLFIILRVSNIRLCGLAKRLDAVKWDRGCFLSLPTQPTRLFLACLLAWVSISVAQAEDYSCEDAGETHIWISPLNPKADGQVKIMAVSTDSPVSELTLIDSQDRRMLLPSRHRGGPPWSLVAELARLNEGHYRVEASRDGRLIACQLLTIDGSGIQKREERTKVWNLATEALYSAWIEALFGAPPEENLSFPSLEPVLRNTERNFLHNHLGLSEDNNLPLTPDCADLPYTLRAYFSWKIGLPFAFRACGRGSTKAPPRCGAATIETEFTHGSSSQASFRKISRQLVNTIHSGSLRTGLEDESTDLYPIPLSREMLWPGTVYADPYGHVLLVVEWLPQTADHPGSLLAVDAQPDNTVARKRVWEGTMLFANTASAGPGFKAFRPLIRTTLGRWRALSNSELADQSDFAPFSVEQDQLSPDDFYARLTRLINPNGLDPKQAYEATLDALVEQIEARVASVNNSEAYFRKHPGSVIPMPSGAAIFQTIGPWEDYSTPSRDMRLIIAINVLNGLAEKIVRHPELFVLNGQRPEEAKVEIEQHHAKRIHERNIRYTRTDGSLWELSVAEVLARKPAYEMAYNPNDCAEERWGAESSTEEYATCRRHAPAKQRVKMEQYRIWFREARRPTQ